MYQVFNKTTGITTFKEGNEPLDARYKNLSVKEFACNDGNEVVVYAEWVPMAFQLLRDVFGALTVSSGFRTYTHNLSVGGAKTSRHLFADAIDILTPDGIDVELFFKVAQAILGYNHGYGIYDWGIHIDDRGERSTWDYRS